MAGRPGLDLERQVVEARVGERLGDGEVRARRLVDGDDGTAVGGEGDLVDGMPHRAGRTDGLRGGRVAEPDRAVLAAEGDQVAAAAERGARSPARGRSAACGGPSPCRRREA